MREKKHSSQLSHTWADSVGFLPFERERRPAHIPLVQERLPTTPGSCLPRHASLPPASTPSCTLFSFARPSRLPHLPPPPLNHLNSVFHCYVLTLHVTSVWWCDPRQPLVVSDGYSILYFLYTPWSFSLSPSVVLSIQAFGIWAWVLYQQSILLACVAEKPLLPWLACCSLPPPLPMLHVPSPCFSMHALPGSLCWQ